MCQVLCAHSTILTNPRSKYNCPQCIEVETKARTRSLSTKVTRLKRADSGFKPRIAWPPSLWSYDNTMSYSQVWVEVKAGGSPRRRFHHAPKFSCVSSYAPNPSLCTPLWLPFWILLPGYRKNFYNLRVPCVHLLAWHGCICRALWTADGGVSESGANKPCWKKHSEEKRPV